MRREVPEISWGDFAVLRVSATMSSPYATTGATIRFLCLHNFSAEACTVNSGRAVRIPARTCSSTCCPTTTAKWERWPHSVVLEPYGYRWYRVGGLDYLLKRSEV